MKNIKEIAAELGISPSTVSRVINNKCTISEETRQRVMEAVRKYNYTPNLVARSLKFRTTSMIGVVVPDITERFFGRIIKAAASAAEKAGYGLLLCDSGEDPIREARCLDELIAKRIDGVILATVDTSGVTMKQLAEHNVATVLVDNELSPDNKLAVEDDTSDAENPPFVFDTVTTDNIMAGKIGCRHLIEGGCRHIGMICGAFDETTGHDRLTGCRMSLSEAGLDCGDEYVRFGDFKEQSGYDAMRTLLTSLPTIDGVLAASSKMTVGAMKALREAGRDDIKLVGFDISDPYDSLIMGIPSVIQQENEIGHTAVELLLNRISGKCPNRQCIKLAPDILVP